MLTKSLPSSIRAGCVAVLLALTACGGKESPKPAGGGETASKTTQPAAGPASGAVPFISSGLELGKKWTASSQKDVWQGSGKMTDGPGNLPFPIFFHTQEEESPWIEIDLETPTRVASVEVLNRTDCCGERAVPLVVELSPDRKTWREVAKRNENFVDWKAAFSPQETRYVRLRVPRRTNFHLERVVIH
jgi:F5/8 type C domain